MIIIIIAFIVVAAAATTVLNLYSITYPELTVSEHFFTDCKLNTCKYTYRGSNPKFHVPFLKMDQCI